MATGVLIVSCLNTDSIYAIDPISGDVQILVGGEPKTESKTESKTDFKTDSKKTESKEERTRFIAPIDLLVVDCEGSLYVADSHRIARVKDLPHTLFTATVSGPVPNQNQRRYDTHT